MVEAIIAKTEATASATTENAGVSPEWIIPIKSDYGIKRGARAS